MPSLQQIQAFRKKYSTKNKNPNNLRLEMVEFLIKVDNQVLNENKHYGTRLEKRMFALNESFKNTMRVNASLQPTDEATIQYLEGQKKTNAVILFIDITSFSTKCQFWSSDKLADYLDDYYDKVIPIIYKHKGEVEKIIGDGIICIFGQPFLEESLIYENADKASKEIISILLGSDKEVKIALHEGEIMYYKNKTEQYQEYTMIGKPLTELFRLEGVSENNAINYYSDETLAYDKKCETIIWSNVSNGIEHWNKSSLIAVQDLKGVSFQNRKTLKKKS